MNVKKEHIFVHRIVSTLWDHMYAVVTMATLLTKIEEVAMVGHNMPI